MSISKTLEELLAVYASLDHDSTLRLEVELAIRNHLLRSGRIERTRKIGAVIVEKEDE